MVSASFSAIGESAARAGAAGLTRRTFLGGVGALGATALLAGCSGASRRTEISFFQTKPEAVGYFDELCARFNESQSSVLVRHDSTSNLSAGFVRGNPPDIAAFTYNLERSRLMQRGALSDLSDMPEADRIRPEVHELVDQYAIYPGRTSVLPYSITAASVIYNRQIFADQGLEVPTTWDEMLAVCDALEGAGIAPIYSTFCEPWTIAQGLFDYTTGGSLDVAEFFAAMAEECTAVGADSAVSFQRDFCEPVERMVQLAGYSNGNARSRGYGDGNTAMARGEGAMYMQGPWAFGEIAKAGTEVDLGTFPLPMTDDPQANRVRVNVDLALWISEESTKQDAAREFLAFLMQPEIQDIYNRDFLAFGTTVDAPPADDERIVEMQKYYDDARFYQGASKAIPLTIPAENYLQGIVTGSSVEGTLRTMDADWARLAFRG